MTNVTTNKTCDQPEPQHGGENCTCNNDDVFCDGLRAEIIEPCNETMCLSNINPYLSTFIKNATSFGKLLVPSKLISNKNV